MPEGRHRQPQVRIRDLHPASAAGPPLWRGCRTGTHPRRAREVPPRRQRPEIPRRPQGGKPGNHQMAGELPLLRLHQGLPRRRDVLPELADPAGRRHVRRMHAAGNAAAEHSELRFRRRLRRVPHGHRREGPSVHGYGRTPHERMGRGRRRTRRRGGRIQGHRQPAGRANVRSEGHRHRRALLHPGA